MAERRQAIIISTGMDNTQIMRSAQNLVSYVKGVGQEIKRGFMPPGMTEDLVAYYRRAGVASGAAFREGQKTALGASAGGGAGGGLILGGAAAGPIAGAAAAGVAISASNIERASELKRIADLTGLSVEQVQRMDAAFRRMNVDVQTANESMIRLNALIGKARSGGPGSEQAVEFFNAFKVDIANKDTATIFSEIQDAMKKTADQSQRLAMGVELAGKGGKELVPLWEQGSATVNKMGDSIVATTQEIENLTKASVTAREVWASITTLLEKATGKIYGLGEKLGQFVGKALGHLGIDTSKIMAKVGIHAPEFAAKPGNQPGTPGIKTQEQTESARLDEQHAQNQLEIYRKTHTARERIDNDMVREAAVKERMAGLDKESKSYKELQLKLDSAIKDQIGDQKELSEQQTESKRKANLLADKASQKIDHDNDLLRQQAEIQRNIGAATIAQKREEVEHYSGGKIPSLEEMASGGGFMTRLKKSYAPGGQFDMMRGSPFAAQARNLETLQYQYAWNVLHPGANSDALVASQKSKIDEIMGVMDKAGIGPGAKFEKMNNNLTALNDKNAEIITALAKDGIIVRALTVSE